MENSNTLQKIMYGVAAVCIVVVLIFGVMWLGQQDYNRKAAQFETDIDTQFADCMVLRTNSINAIINLADVDKSTKEYLIAVVKAGNPQVEQGFAGAVAGNPQSLLLALSAVGKTNFTITAENLQHQITSYNSEMTLCSQRLNRIQNVYRAHLGFTMQGKPTNQAFPTSYFQPNSGYPTELVGTGLNDNDHDGIITPLDYRAIGSVATKDEQNGTDSGPIKLP